MFYVDLTPRISATAKIVSVLSFLFMQFCFPCLTHCRSDSYGNGAGLQSPPNFGGKQQFRGKMRGGGGRGRQKPY